MPSDLIEVSTMNQINIILDILVAVAALTVAVVVGRDNIKKRIITELRDLVKVLTTKVDTLEETVGKLRYENAELKETVDGYSELVREGYLSGFSRPRGRNSSATTKSTTNRKP
jgi:hypothetical protein